MRFLRQRLRKRLFPAVFPECEKAGSGEGDRDAHLPAEFPGRLRGHGSGHRVLLPGQDEHGGSLRQIGDLGPAVTGELHLGRYAFAVRRRKLRVQEGQLSHRAAVDLDPLGGQLHRRGRRRAEQTGGQQPESVFHKPGSFLFYSRCLQLLNMTRQYGPAALSPSQTRRSLSPLDSTRPST